MATAPGNAVAFYLRRPHFPSLTWAASLIEKRHLVARVKDDRSQPAQWVDPSSLTPLALGDARITARPSSRSANSWLWGCGCGGPGSVWLTSPPQIAACRGWAWNPGSARREIVTGTTGPVQFSLDAV